MRLLHSPKARGSHHALGAKSRVTVEFFKERSLSPPRSLPPVLAGLPAVRCGDKLQRHPLQYFRQALQVRGWIGMPKFAVLRPPANPKKGGKIMETAGQRISAD